jgi:hypothetical protein
MEETNLGIDQPELKAEKAFDGKLPTNPEIIKDGLSSYLRVLNRLPADLQIALQEDTQIQGCFVGVTPEVGSENDISFFEGPNKTRFEEIKRIFAEEAPEMVIIGSGKSLINLKAAAQVMANFPEYFPQVAKDNLENWLKLDITQWSTYSEKPDDIREIRWGLLSGYPLESVLQWCRNKNDRGFNLQNKYHNIYYSGYDMVQDTLYLKQLDQLFDESGIAKIKPTPLS